MMNEIKENSLDICVVTETWLNNLDDIWLDRSEFNYHGYSISNVNIKIGKGGGLALITRRPITVKLKVSANKDTFEYAIQELKIKTDIRKENSLLIKASDNDFAEEFAEFFLDKIMKIRNNLKDKKLYIKQLQRVRSMAAKLIQRRRKADSVTACFERTTLVASEPPDYPDDGLEMFKWSGTTIPDRSSQYGY